MIKTDIKQCPNCGAAIQGDTCEYCGTQFFDFACVDTSKPFYLKIKHNGEIAYFKVWLTQTEISTRSNDLCVDVICGCPRYIAAPPDVDIQMLFKVISDEGRLYQNRKGGALLHGYY